MKKYIGDKHFYRMVLVVVVPIMIQNGITNFVSLLDNIMVGQVGTEQMSGVAIANQLIFVFNLCIFGAVSGAGIFGAQFYGSGDHEGVRDTLRFKLVTSLALFLIAALVFTGAGEQLIRLYLELLLLSMIRRNLPNPVKPAEEIWAPGGGGSAAYIQIMDYLKAHICGYVTIEDICRENLIGRSQLQKIFREQHNCGVIDFFTKMKVEYAKELIREKNQNFTQISEFLGYSSIHYFSRQFKKITGMTPSEYTASIMARSESQKNVTVQSQADFHAKV